MEPAGAVSGVQPEAWRRFFGKPVAALIGQEKAWQHAALTDEQADLLVLPTGYGKTLAGMGVYVIKRGRGIANRLLWAVPTNEQREQMVPLDPHAETISQEAARFFGVRLGEAVVIDKPERALKYHREGTAEVFVTSYQQLLVSQRGIIDLFRLLLETPGPDGQLCNWMVVRDEAHHQGEQGKWGQRLEDLAFRHHLHMSATPLRTDRERLVGVPAQPTPDGGRTYRAAVEVSVKDAVIEGAIRPPKGHIQSYFIDALTGEGEQIRITTDSLRNEQVTDFSSYEARRGLRYQGKYLSTMLADALECLNSKLLLQPAEHQMLGFAMTCGHAEAVTGELNALQPGVADWVGVGPNGRSDRDNAAVMRRFKRNQLQCLVQVEKAGEGFNLDRCSVLLFLDLTQSPTRNWQHVGRGLRRNRRLRREVDFCDVFASSDTPIAELVRELEANIGLYREDEADEARERAPSEVRIELPDLAVLDAEWYRTDIIGPAGQAQPYPEWMHRAAEAEGLTVEQVARVVGYQPGTPPAVNGSVAAAHERSDLALWTGRVVNAVNKIAAGVTKMLCPAGQFDKAMHVRLIKRLHGRWKGRNGGHDGSDAAGMKRKYKWCQEVAAEVNEHRFPGWLVNGEEIGHWYRKEGGGLWPRTP